MVATTIAAVRGDRSLRYSDLALSHFAGLVVGATGLMGALVALGALVGAGNDLSRGIAATVAVLAVIWGAAAIAGRPLAFPSPSWQVPLAWRYFFRPRTYMFWYGVGLGTGFFTRLRTVSLYVCAGLVLALGDPLFALAAGVAYAGALAFPVAALSHRTDESVRDSPPPGDERLIRLDGSVLIVTGVAIVLAQVLAW